MGSPPSSLASANKRHKRIASGLIQLTEQLADEIASGRRLKDDPSSDAWAEVMTLALLPGVDSGYKAANPLTNLD
jgi:hypothetical protein